MYMFLGPSAWCECIVEGGVCPSVRTVQFLIYSPGSGDVWHCCLHYSFPLGLSLIRICMYCSGLLAALHKALIEVCNFTISLTLF
jgi:hypothetical protein